MTKTNLNTTWSLLLFTLLSSPIYAQITVGDTLSASLMDELKNVQILNKEGERVWSKEGLLVVKFWATWCTPCVAGFPKFDEIYAELVDEGVDFIAVSNEKIKRVEHFLSSREYQFPVGTDEDSGLNRQFGVSAIPEHLVIDGAGIVRYRGLDLSSEILSNLVQGKELPKEESPGIDFDNKESVVSDGGGAPGQDPVYNGMTSMMGPEEEEWSPREDAIEQVIIRKSLETTAGWYGYRTSDDGYIGMTYSGGKVNEIYSFLLNATSPLWVVDTISGGVRYDLVYWKENKKKIPAFKKEMLALLKNALHIGLRKRFIEAEVVVLSVHKETSSLRKGKEVSIDETYDFIPVATVIARLEEMTGQRYITDFDKDYLISWQKDKFNLFRMNAQEIEETLLLKGVSREKKAQRIQIYETILLD